MFFCFSKKNPIFASVMRKLIFILAAVMVSTVGLAQTNGAINSSYYSLFGPLTFYHSVAQNRLSLMPAGSNEELSDEISSALMRVYLDRPDLVQTTESEMQASGSLRDDVATPITQSVAILDESYPQPETLLEVDSVEVAIEKPQFWKFKGDGYLQFMQNYVSDNWYKGGESNYSAVGSVTLEANYDNKSRWKWENKLEMKLGFQTSPSDTVNKFKTKEAGSWDYNRGGDPILREDGLYVFGTQGGADIVVPEDGNYMVFFNDITGFIRLIKQ